MPPESFNRKWARKSGISKGVGYGRLPGVRDSLPGYTGKCEEDERFVFDLAYEEDDAASTHRFWEVAGVLTIEVCVGSSCYLRGAPEVIEILKGLIERRAPRRIELKGTFCLEHCNMGVTVRFMGLTFSKVLPGDVEELFEQEILPRLNQA